MKSGLIIAKFSNRRPNYNNIFIDVPEGFLEYNSLYEGQVCYNNQHFDGIGFAILQNGARFIYPLIWFDRHDKEEMSFFDFEQFYDYSRDPDFIVIYTDNNVEYIVRDIEPYGTTLIGEGDWELNILSENREKFKVYRNIEA